MINLSIQKFNSNEKMQIDNIYDTIQQVQKEQTLSKQYFNFQASYLLSKKGDQNSSENFNREELLNIILNVLKLESLQKQFMECKSQVEAMQITENMKFTLNYILEKNLQHLFIENFDKLLKSFLFIINNSNIGSSFVTICDLERFLQHRDFIDDTYYYMILMECILDASTYTEQPNDFVQPNLIARFILNKISNIDSVFTILGNYLFKCYKFEFKMFQNMLKFGMTQNALNLILYFSKLFIKENEIALFIEMKKNLIPILIKNMKIFQFFIEIQNLLYYYLIRHQQHKIEQYLVQQYFNEIIQFYLKHEMDFSQIHQQMAVQFVSNIPQYIYRTDEIAAIENRLKQQNQIDDNNLNFFNQQIDEIKWKPVTLVGLKNIAVDSSLNSFIQVLFWTLDFRRLIFEVFKRDDNLFSKPLSLKTKFLRCFLFLNSMNENEAYIPQLLKGSLKESYRTFGINDAAQSQFGINLFQDIKQNFDPEEYDQIKELFYGKRKLRYICQMCGQQIQKEDQEFLYINQDQDYIREIEMKNEIYDSISIHQQNEVIQLNCDSCKKENNQICSYEYSKVPNNIIIKLNKFDLQAQKYPALKEKLRIKENQNYLIYELYAFILQFEKSTKEEHYISCCKVNKDWYIFNNQFVTQCDLDLNKISKSLEKKGIPYLLFYRRLKE